MSTFCQNCNNNNSNKSIKNINNLSSNNKLKILMKYEPTIFSEHMLVNLHLDQSFEVTTSAMEKNFWINFIVCLILKVWMSKVFLNTYDNNNKVITIMKIIAIVTIIRFKSLWNMHQWVFFLDQMSSDFDSNNCSEVTKSWMEKISQTKYILRITFALKKNIFFLKSHYEHNTKKKNNHHNKNNNCNKLKIFIKCTPTIFIYPYVGQFWL